MIQMLTRRLFLLFAVADTPFSRKYNAFADQMNVVSRELKLNVANVAHMRSAAVLWEKLYADEGWLK